MQTVKPVASSWDDTLTHGYLPTAKISARLSGNPIQRKHISVLHRLTNTNISEWNSILACQILWMDQCGNLIFFPDV